MRVGKNTEPAASVWGRYRYPYSATKIVAFALDHINFDKEICLKNESFGQVS